MGSGRSMSLKNWLEQTHETLQLDTPIKIGAKPDDGLLFEREWLMLRRSRVKRVMH
ncbi:hypothetical protein Salpa_3453 [Sporomusa sp. KB1]|jgi:hypothetical protein|nr:hypothetical protein Salpa_3453 [Sporomusa sp. KB1]